MESRTIKVTASKTFRFDPTDYDEDEVDPREILKSYLNPDTWNDSSIVTGAWEVYDHLHLMFVEVSNLDEIHIEKVEVVPDADS